MKDYIDKLREDYHRKKLQKLALGDKFKDFGNNIRSKYYDIRYGTGNPPEQEVDDNGNPIIKTNNPSLSINTGTNNIKSLSQSKDGKLPALTNAQMGLGVDKDVIYAPGYTPATTGVNPFLQSTTSTYDGKEAPSFMKETLKKEEAKKTEETNKQQGFFIPPPGDLTTNLFNLGRAAKSGNKFGVATNATLIGIKGAGSFLSGLGYQNAEKLTEQFNQQQMIDARKKYESNPQYKNTNYMGGPTQTRAGGTIRIYEDGGEQQMDPRMQQMMAQQQGQVDPRMQQEMDPRMAEQQQQMDPRMQQQQETQMNQQEAQAYQQIAEKLVSSFETIEEIADYLNENGVDEVAFNAIIKFAQDMMEDKEESADDNEEATEEPEEGEEEMRKGGKKFNKKVGEYIEFEYGGKTYKGTIKSIKNGQIFLK